MPRARCSAKRPPISKPLQAEFIVLVKAWDETFAQTVHQRFSYRYNELVWGGQFTPAFGVDAKGDLQVHVDKVGTYVTENSQSLPPAPLA